MARRGARPIFPNPANRDRQQCHPDIVQSRPFPFPCHHPVIRYPLHPYCRDIFVSPSSAYDVLSTRLRMFACQRSMRKPVRALERMLLAPSNDCNYTSKK